MSKLEKIRDRILRGSADSNIPFDDLCSLLEHLGFERRVRGSHHIFFMTGIEEIINVQPLRSKAKAYQVKQVRNLMLKYRLGADDE